MLDTIVLTLNRRQFSVTDPDRFTPSARSVLDPMYYPRGVNGRVSCTQNTSKEDIRQCIYKPRLSINRRPQKGRFVITLRVEFSAPKLLLGNNFDELTDDDFRRLCKKLVQVLAEMGVKITARTLAKVNVSAIHYSKNITLTDYTSSSMILRELTKVDMTRRLDINNTDYRNDGHALKYHANSYEIAFYDKVKDMHQAKISEKRAVERDSAQQLELFMQYVAPKAFEVLRMEVRLGTRQKIRDVLARVGRKPENMSFHQLYSAEIAREILLYYWHSVVSDVTWLGMNQLKPEDIYRAIERGSDVPLKPSKILQMVGAVIIADSVGVMGLRNLFGSTDRSWQRMKKELKQLAIPKHKNYRAVDQVEANLQSFLPLRIINQQKGGNTP